MKHSPSSLDRCMKAAHIGSYGQVVLYLMLLSTVTHSDTLTTGAIKQLYFFSIFLFRQLLLSHAFPSKSSLHLISLTDSPALVSLHGRNLIKQDDLKGEEVTTVV